MRGLPGGAPVLFGALTLLIFAFLLGHCTAGGGGEDDKSAAPTVTTAPTTTTTAPVILRTYTVSEDDTLAKVASRFGVTIEVLTFVNNIVNANYVFVGQVLKIPPQDFVIPTTTTPTTAPKKKKNNN